MEQPNAYDSLRNPSDAALRSSADDPELFDVQGNIVATYGYSPYGELLSSASPGIGEDNPFRFSSEYADDELGLVYYNYRHYNPADGRWISRDLIEEDGGMNLYGFAKNRPVDRIDFLGEKCPPGSIIKKIGDKEYYRTNQQSKEPEVNGCGSKDGMAQIGDKKIQPPDFCFKKACDNHDICWGTCGSDRLVCDVVFLGEMIDICKSKYRKNKTKFTLCIEAAKIYHTSVHSSKKGDEAWQKAQDEYCEWKCCDE